MCLTHNVLWCIQVQTTVNKSCRRSLLLKVLICDGAEALRCVVGFANRMPDGRGGKISPVARYEGAVKQL